MRKARFSSVLSAFGGLAIMAISSPLAHADDMLSAAAAPPALPAMTTWPALFMEAVTPAQSVPGHAYDVEVTQTEDPDWGALRYTVTFSDTGERSISLLQTPLRADSEDLMEELSESDSDIWCDDFRDLVKDEVTLLEDREDAAVFTFAASPDAAASKRERKIFEKTQITVEVDKTDQQVRAFRYQLTEPVKPMPVARVFSFEITGDCGRAPDGRAHLSKLVTSLSGKAMSREFNQHTVQTYSNLTKLTK